MKREQKTRVVDEIAAQIADAEAIYAADYRGLSVSQAAALRATLREANATFRIVKNTLTARAAEKAGAEQVKALIEGPTAFTFVRGDPALAAKALDSFARQEQVLDVRGGVMAGEPIGADAFRVLARLPGRDQLNAQLAGVVASPLTGLVRGLGSLLSGLAVALAGVRDKKSAEAPAEELPAAVEAAAPPVEEQAPSEEAPADRAAHAEEEAAPAEEAPAEEPAAAAEEPEPQSEQPEGGGQPDPEQQTEASEEKEAG
jgi:large subunit ribosomal protein L10